MNPLFARYQSVTYFVPSNGNPLPKSLRGNHALNLVTEFTKPAYLLENDPLPVGNGLGVSLPCGNGIRYQLRYQRCSTHEV